MQARLLLVKSIPGQPPCVTGHFYKPSRQAQQMGIGRDSRPARSRGRIARTASNQWARQSSNERTRFNNEGRPCWQPLGPLPGDNSTNQERPQAPMAIYFRPRPAAPGTGSGSSNRFNVCKRRTRNEPGPRCPAAGLVPLRVFTWRTD